MADGKRPRRRANGEGTIYERKDGRWEGAAYVLTTDGTYKRVRMYGKTREEVHGKLVEAQQRSNRGVPVADKPWKLGEYLDCWLEHIVRPSARWNTCKKYEQTVRLHLKPGLGEQRLDRLRVARVQAFLAAARTERLYPAFVLLLVYGLRRGEVLGLSWDDVDLDEEVVRVEWQMQRVDGRLTRTEVKTAAGRRHLPLLPIAREAVIELAERQMFARRRAGAGWEETGLIFTTRNGRPVEPRNLARVFERICDQAGLRRIRLHDLRHTSASLLKKMGVPPSDAKEILGHARISVTLEIYTHGDSESHRDGLGRVAGELFGDQED